MEHLGIVAIHDFNGGLDKDPTGVDAFVHEEYGGAGHLHPGGERILCLGVGSGLNTAMLEIQW